MDKKNNTPIDDDDLPPELEDLPDALLGKKSQPVVGSGKFEYGDYTQVKEEREIEIPKQVEKPKKEGFSGDLKKIWIIERV